MNMPRTRIALTVLLSLSLAACAATRTQKTAGETLDDSVLTARVKTALIEEPSTKARQIDVEVFRGQVQLNGFVDSAAERSAAEDVARHVNGVRSVRNNLSLRGETRTAGAVIDDSTITAEVKMRLTENSSTKARQINVETREGTVQLSGFVNSEAERSEAVRVASGVKGVKSVENRMQVKTG